MYKSLREEMAKEPGLRGRWYLYAAWHNRELREDETTDKEGLNKRIGDRLKEVNEQREKQISNRDAKWVYLDVIALYRQDRAMREVVEEAEKQLQRLPQ
jgi:hypothetical protein